MKVTCLDHGYVKFLNMAGPVPGEVDTTDVAKCARISFDNFDKERSREQDLKLCEYLLKNLHTTPWEMIEVWLEMKLPIFVARQFVRHRTCLTGDTILSFDLPSGKTKGSMFRHQPMSIAELHRKWHTGALPIKDRWGHNRVIPLRDRLERMSIRCLDEESGAIVHSRVLDIWKAGEKQVFELCFEDGTTLTGTGDHQIFSENGWINLSDSAGQSIATSAPSGPVTTNTYLDHDYSNECWLPIRGYEGKYEVSSKGRVRGLVNTKNVKLTEPTVKKQTLSQGGYLLVSLSKNGKSHTRLVSRLVAEAFLPEVEEKDFVCHKDSNTFNNEKDNLYWGDAQDNANDRYATGAYPGLCLGFKQCVSIKPAGVETVYDLSVDKYNNYFANGVLVHNCSINEVSGRYSTLPAEWYIPATVGGKPTHNKQGQSDTLDSFEQKCFQHGLNDACSKSYEFYLEALEHGVAAEHARLFLHLNHYTNWIWKQDLWNMMHFLKLRLDKHAQVEARVYAEAIYSLLATFIPEAMALFDKYVRIQDAEVA